MASMAVIFGALLSILGVALYGMSEVAHPITALIPTFFGIALIVLGIVARNEKARMHAMHGAALLTLVGFIFPAYRVAAAMVGGASWSFAHTGQALMAALCVIFLVLCVRSFIAARRSRKQS